MPSVVFSQVFFEACYQKCSFSCMFVGTEMLHAYGYVVAVNLLGKYNTWLSTIDFSKVSGLGTLTNIWKRFEDRSRYRSRKPLDQNGVQCGERIQHKWFLKHFFFYPHGCFATLVVLCWPHQSNPQVDTWSYQNPVVVLWLMSWQILWNFGLTKEAERDKKLKPKCSM